MRVSNDTLRSAFLAALDAAQRRVIDTQEKVSSGKRVNKPSDDPVAAARMAHLDASLSRLDQYKSNSDFARNQLGLEESALDDVISGLQRVRELALQGNNSTTSESDRKDIAAEIRQARDALLALANGLTLRQVVAGGAASTTTSLRAAASARVAPRVIARVRSACRTTSGQSMPVTR